MPDKGASARQFRPAIGSNPGPHKRIVAKTPAKKLRTATDTLPLEFERHGTDQCGIRNPTAWAHNGVAPEHRHLHERRREHGTFVRDTASSQCIGFDDHLTAQRAGLNHSAGADVDSISDDGIAQRHKRPNGDSITKYRVVNLRGRVNATATADQVRFPGPTRRPDTSRA